MAERVWHLSSRAIDEMVRADDQFAAWATLRERPAEDFGLVVSAEPDESADPIMVRTSGLMFAWGRDGEAEAFIVAAIANGLPDSTESDRRFARERAAALNQPEPSSEESR